MGLVRNGINAAGATLLGVALAVLVSAAAAMPVGASPVELGRQEFSRKFDTRRVTHAYTLTADGPLRAGSRVDLRLGLSTALTGTGLGREPRAGLADGYVALVLPPELTALGALRLFYRDPASGKEEFLYSADLPSLARYRALGVPPALATASATDLFSYYTSAARALDPTAAVFPPAAAALRRVNGAAGALSAAWLQPVDVHQKRLLGLFETATQGSAPEIVAKLTVKVNRDPSLAKLKLFAGALSCAAAELDIPPGMAPPGALPLSELDPRAYPAPKPVKGADPAPAATAPTLVYSCEWCSWEDELSLAAPSAPVAQLEIPSLPAVDGTPSVALETAPTGVEPAKPARPAPVSSASSSDTNSSTARQVQVGTLPAPGGDDEQPLKPITGSAGQRGSQSDSSYPGPGSGGNQLPPPPGFSGSAPGSVRYYGPGGPDNMHGGQQTPPSMTPPGLGSMVLVPAGEFLMGTDSGTPYGDADELPQHKVNLPAFLIDKYPVTNRQFAQFVVSSAYQPEGDWQRYNSPALLDLPVRSVTWNDAKAYARWAGKRLPSEAEWEKAARGTDGRLYPWGNEWNADILPRGEFNYQLVTASKAASPYGAMAMCGVLWQWTASPWHEYPFDPNARGDKLVLRGGAFSNGRNIVRCANRYFEAAGVALNTFTFRCVKDTK